MPVAPIDLLFIVLLPAALGLIVTAASRALPAGRWRDRFADAGWAVALALAPYLAFRSAPIGNEWLFAAPTNTLERAVLGGGALAMVLGLTFALFRPGRWLAGALLIIVAAAAITYVLRFKILADEGWSWSTSTIIVAPLCLLALGWWATFAGDPGSAGAARTGLSPGGVGSLERVALVVILAAAAALVMAMIGSLRFGLLIASLSAASGGAFAGGLILGRGGERRLSGGPASIAVLTMSLLAGGYFTMDEPPPIAIALAALIGVSPGYVWGGRFLGAQTVSLAGETARKLVRIGFVVAVVAILLTVAALAFLREPAEADEYGLLGRFVLSECFAGASAAPTDARADFRSSG